MDPWKYFDITHRRHVLCNPTSLAKLDDTIALLKLDPGDRVVDIACGKGELLARLAERHGVGVVGVDTSPYCIADARNKLRERAPMVPAELLVMDGADFRPDPPDSFALASCIGASWVFKGHRGTLRALKGMAAPGGYVMVGEIFQLQEPDPEYLAFDGLTRGFCASHFENVRAGEEEGLVPLYAAVSSGDDWDRYETLQWHAVAEWAAANPNDPDLPEVRDKQTHAREVYLRWQRETLGWALYLFKKA
jgi:ubiquinone/menaquinone biosynthesis C-methylase UbiE